MLIGYYSQQAIDEAGVGTNIYSTPGGGEVEITLLLEEGSPCAWPDAVCLGPVLEPLRAGRYRDRSIIHDVLTQRRPRPGRVRLPGPLRVEDIATEDNLHLFELDTKDFDLDAIRNALNPLRNEKAPKERAPDPVELDL